jgi:Peptidase propeptide and YPEB domain
MNKPNRRTAIAATIGGIALTATAAGAVAMASGTPEPTIAPPVTEESTPQGSSDQCEPGSGSGGSSSGSGSSDDATAPTSDAPADGVSREQAIEIAERALAEHGDVPPLDEIERDREHGRAVWDIEFGDDHEVYVDIETGDVVRVDIDDDRYDD